MSTIIYSNITMTTIKSVIIKKYLEIVEQLKTVIQVDVFPSLLETDIVDVLILFQLYFSNGVETYKQTIQDILEIKNIIVNEKQLNDIYEIVYPFIMFLKDV